MVELLMVTETGLRVADRLRTDEILCAPQLLVIECLQVFRRFAQIGAIDEHTGDALVGDLRAFAIDLYDHNLVATRVWELRDNLTAYDAAYIALSELLDVTLLTTDAKLGGAPGHRARVELIHNRR